MKVSFIESKDRDDIIVFFPESYRFFQAKRIVKEIIDSYIKGIPLEKISEKYNLSYAKLQEIIDKVKESLNQDNKVQLEEKLKSFDNSLEKLVINVTGKCNMKCKYCYEQMEEVCEQDEHISLETIDNIFEVLIKKYNRIAAIQFFGGEAFLNIEAIEYICNKVIKLYNDKILLNLPVFGVVSNGTLMNEKIMQLIKKYNINMTVSFDGIPSIHNKVRVFDKNKESASLIINNVKRLMAYHKIPLSVQVTYNKEHSKENVKIVDIIKYLRNEFDAKNIHITPVVANSDDKLYLEDTIEFENSIDEMFADNEITLYPELVNRFIISLARKKASPFLCSAGIGQLSIASNGDVYPCFMLIGTEKYKMGNVHDKNLFREQNFINVDNLFRMQTKEKIDKCKNCFLINICNSCIGANNILNKSAFEPSDYFCEINRNMFKKVLFNLADKYKMKKINIR